MNKISPEVIRMDDSLIAKFKFMLGKQESSNSTTIEFWDGANPVDIISTTAGAIKENKVIFRKPSRYVEVCVPHQKTPIECRLAYLNDDNLIESETTVFELEGADEIKPGETSTSTVSGKGVSFQERMDNLADSLSKKSSEWNLKITIDDNIHVKVLRCGSKPAVVCFGQTGHEITVSDFLFTIYPDIKEFSIPIELILKYHRRHNKNSKVYIFELVRPDFHKIPDVLYKTPISNAVNLSALKSPPEHLLSYFRSPTGETFDSKWKVENNLPILKHGS